MVCDFHACAAALTARADMGLLPHGHTVPTLYSNLSLDAMPFIANALVEAFSLY
jgi:hypothetical protein